MIAYKNALSLVEAQTVPISNLTETPWAHMVLVNNKSTHIGVYYHDLSDKSPESVEDPGRILDSFPSNSPIIIEKDCNAADIRWKSHIMAPVSDGRIICETVISIFSNHHLKQLIKEHIREKISLTCMRPTTQD